MCVGPDGVREGLFSRASFVGLVAGAAAPLVLSSDALAQDAGASLSLPIPPGRFSAGNTRAVTLASASPIVRSTYGRVLQLAGSIIDGRSRDDVLGLLTAARPTYASKHESPESRVAVRDALARDGFVAADAPPAGLFPPGTESTSAYAVQPFWSTPGSVEGSHHAYPGGLAVHEYFNATLATEFAGLYDRLYFDGRPTIDRDTVIAAALYHDVMKRVVFQWRDDGTLTDELTVAGTGAHHVLSGAEAITRGRDARFVTVLLSAHAAPSLGDEAKVVAWCRAAALLAGVDAVDYGLVRRDGSGYALAADPAPTEAFVNHLSDHDYVLSIHAMHVVSDRLRARYARTNRDRSQTFAWYRAGILARTTALRLYDVLGRRGQSAFDAEVARTETVLQTI